MSKRENRRAADRLERLLARSRSTSDSRERSAMVREALSEALRVENVAESAIGELLYTVHKHAFWREWGFDSFRAYVERECGFSYRKAQQLVRVYRAFVVKAGVSPYGLSRLPWSKAALVAGRIKRGNAAEIIRDVEALSYGALLAKVRGADPPRETPPGTGPAPTEAAVEHPGRPAIDPPAPGGEPGVAAPLPRTGRGWRFPPPAEDYFYVSEEDWEQLCCAVGNAQNCIVLGPSGCGKSTICELAMRAGGRQFAAFNCGGMTEPRSALVGNTHFDPAKGTWFGQSRFVRSILEPGTGILLDEISRMSRDGYNLLLTLLDGQGYLALDEREDGAVVHRAPGVYFLATANLGQEFPGAEELDKALKDRFRAIVDLRFPPEAKELAVLLRRCPGLGEVDARRLIDIAARQRQLAAEGEFVELVSTRALLNAGAQIAAGIAFERAVTYCVINHFSNEGGEVSERAKLGQVLLKGRADGRPHATERRKPK